MRAVSLGSPYLNVHAGGITMKILGIILLTIGIFFLGLGFFIPIVGDWMMGFGFIVAVPGFFSYNTGKKRQLVKEATQGYSSST